MDVHYPDGPYTIALEGIDGCGKSTHGRLLANRIEETGRKVLFTRQPGGTNALNVREILLWQGNLCTKARHLLFAADNAQHIEDTVRPALANRTVVVMDRGIGSAFAYQGWGEGFGIERVRLTYSWATDNFEPDLTIFMDLDPAQVIVRRSMEGQAELPLDSIEERPSDYHRRVYAGYCELVEMFDSWVRVPLTPDTTREETIAAIDAAITKAISR